MQRSYSDANGMDTADSDNKRQKTDEGDDEFGKPMRNDECK